MNVKVRLPGVGFGADVADVGLLPSVHPDVFDQGVVVVAGLVADGAHVVGDAGVGGHVGPQGRTTPEGLVALAALEVPLSGVNHHVRVQVETVPEGPVAVLASVLVSGGRH